MGFFGLCGSSSRLPLSVDDDHGLVTLASYALERPQLDVSLHDGVRKLAANQALCIKDLGMACTQLSEPKHERFTLGNRSTCFCRQSSSCQKRRPFFKNVNKTISWHIIAQHCPTVGRDMCSLSWPIMIIHSRAMSQVVFYIAVAKNDLPSVVKQAAVFSGLRATWFLAASPISRSVSVKAT